MDRVGGQRLQTVPGRHGSHVESLSDWLKSLDTSKVPRKIRQEIEHLDPHAGVPSKAAQAWLIGALLTKGKKDVLIAMINQFGVTYFGVRARTRQCVGVLIAVVDACPS